MVLTEHADGLIDPRLADLSDHDAKPGERPRHFIQKVGPAEFQLALLGELPAGMHEHRHGELLGLGVKVHGPRISGVEVLVGRRNRDTAQVQVFLGHVQVFDGRGLGGVDAGEADQLLRESAHVVGDILVGDLGTR